MQALYIWLYIFQIDYIFQMEANQLMKTKGRQPLDKALSARFWEEGPELPRIVKDGAIRRISGVEQKANILRAWDDRGRDQ